MPGHGRVLNSLAGTRLGLTRPLCLVMDRDEDLVFGIWVIGAALPIVHDPPDPRGELM